MLGARSAGFGLTTARRARRGREHDLPLQQRAGLVGYLLGSADGLVSHNLITRIKINGEGSHTYSITSEHNIFETGQPEYTKSGTDEAKALPESLYKCNPHCGEGKTAAHDDYELASNPNSIGINWNPGEQTYGPNPGGGSAPTNSGLPVVSGSTVEGEALSTTNGTWEHSPESFTYQWERCNSVGASCVEIGGATATTYTLTGTDVTHTLKVKVTATNTHGSASASSTATSEVTAGGGGTQVCTHTFGPSEQASINGSIEAGKTTCLTAGTYTALTLSSSPASLAKVEAKETSAGHHAVVTIPGVKMSGKNLAINQIFTTGGIEVTAGTGFVAENDDITNSPGGYGATMQCVEANPCTFIVKHNKLHGMRNTSGDGDVVRFDGWSEGKVEENDFYNNEDLAAETGHMDCFQSFNGGGKEVAIKAFSFVKNYIHDNNCEGPPFLQEEPGVGKNIVINDNLYIRGTSTTTKEPCTGCNTNPGTSLPWLNDPYTPITMEHNFENETSGGSIQNCAEDEITAKLNVMATIKHGDSCTPKKQVSEENLWGPGTERWTEGTGDKPVTFKTNELEVTASKAKIKFACSPTCGTGTAANDNYELVGSSAGIDWNPAEQVYGPTN